MSEIYGWTGKVQTLVEPSYYYMAVPKQNAIIIDNMLSRYGYTIARNKVPNIHLPDKRRKYFYFLSMDDAILYSFDGASIPCDAEIEIKNIIKNGITFWNKNQYDNIGNYSTTIFADNVPQGSSVSW